MRDRETDREREREKKRKKGRYRHPLNKFFWGIKKIKNSHSRLKKIPRPKKKMSW
jgi:hypothetical protein